MEEDYQSLNKPRGEFPRMAREEFKKVKRIKTFREGDDYYYSLKENQYKSQNPDQDSPIELISYQNKIK